MIKQPTMPQVARPARKATFPFGFWAAVLTAVVAAISFTIAVQTLPRSGPFCQGGCLTYPYEDAAALVPHDYIWMYPATVMVCLFLVLMSCIHSYAAQNRKLYSQIGLCFAVFSSVVLAMDCERHHAAMHQLCGSVFRPVVVAFGTRLGFVVGDISGAGHADQHERRKHRPIRHDWLPPPRRSTRARAPAAARHP